MVVDASYYMEDLLMNHQKILFIGGGVSRQNGAEDFTIKTVIAMSRALLMQAALIFT